MEQKIQEKCSLGIDTSNYTSSSALLFDDTVIQSKKLLPIKDGMGGIRQSEAVFHHTKQMPEILEKLLPNKIFAIGVSDRPTGRENSYMPCFLVGLNNAKILGKALDVPVYKFSHQQGHIASALYSVKRLDLLDKDFIAFHLSGGTSEIVLVKSGVMGEFKLISQTLDLNAGQAVDRVGLMLSLNFPCGKELDKLAQKCENKIVTKVSIKENNFSFSGIENQCRKLLENGEKPEYIAKYCLEYIATSLDKICLWLSQEYKDLPLVFSGGVSSNTLIRNKISKKYKAFFANPEFACDNAVGLAILAKEKYKMKAKV